MAQYPCPNCGGKMFIEEMHEGFVVPCPHCQDSFRVPRGAAGAQKPIRPPVRHEKGTLPGVEGIGVRGEKAEEELPRFPPATSTASGVPLATEPEEEDAEPGNDEPEESRDATSGYQGAARSSPGFGGAIVSSRAGPFARQPPRPRIPEPRAHGRGGGGEGNSEAVWILVLGIVGIILCPVTSPIAVVMGHKHKTAARSYGRDPDQLAMAGYVLGWVGCIIFALGLLCVLPFTVVAGMAG